MSLYDTENLMQTTNVLLGKNALLLEASVWEEEIIEACKAMKSFDPIHYNTANRYAKSAGNSLKTRMDYILGVDDIMDCELEDGNVFAAIDWTDNPMKLEEKRDRFIARKSIMDELCVDVCLSVCVDNQVLLSSKKERIHFISNALFEIILKVEDMMERNKYAGYLIIDMKSIMSTMPTR